MTGASAHTEAQGREDAQDSPPFVVHVNGEVAANGAAIALRIVRTDEVPVTICLRTEDVQYLVSILLALNGEARRLQPQLGASRPPSGAIPLPLEAINVGQNDNDETFLMLETGGAALMFRVPPESLREVGQTLLTVGTVDGRPS
jgi:hypothetical protein